jgi:hypothetical protein
MVLQPKHRPPRPEIEVEALAHGIRHWAAETDAANRLSSRSGTILMLIVAVLGYGVWNVTSLEAIQPEGVRTAMRLLLGASLVLLLSALVVLLVPRRPKQSSTASSLLHWPREASLDPARLSRGQLLEQARGVLWSATEVLSAQNSRVQTRTDEAQTLVLSAALCAGTAVLCYLFSRH